MEKKKMTRSLNDRMIGGVCGGLGQYLDVDPTIIRLIFVFLALCRWTRRVDLLDHVSIGTVRTSNSHVARTK